MSINLKVNDSSNQYVDMQNSINNARNNKLTLVNTSYKINYNNELVLTDENCLYRYRGLLQQYTIKYRIPEKYYYKPELVSLEVYGTVDLWYLILWMNPISSVMEFNKPVINIFDPSKFHIINEIIEKEKESIKKNNKSPKYVEDLTLKPIIVGF